MKKIDLKTVFSLFLSGMILLAGSTGSLASSFDVLGVNPRAIAMGGAYTALVNDPSAVYYNPAALTRIRHVQFHLYFHLTDDALSSGLPTPLVPCSSDPERMCPNEAAIYETFGEEEGAKILERYQKQLDLLEDLANPINAGYDPEVSETPPAAEEINTANEAAAHPQAMRGYTIGIATPLNDYLKFGLLYHTPFEQVVQQKLIGVTDPYYLDFDNRAQRAIILPGFGFRFPQIPALSLGASLSLLQSTIGATENFFPLDQEDLPLQALTSAKLTSSPRLNFGLLFTPREKLAIGVNFFEESYLKLTAKSHFTASVLDIAGITVIPLIEAIALYAPRQISLGIAYDPISLVTVSFDLEFEQWDKYSPPFPRVSLIPPEREELDDFIERLLISPINQPIPILHFRNTFNPRAGIELHPRKDFALRAGYAYQPTPTPEQTFSTNILDTNTHVFSGGIGTAFKLWKKLPFVPEKISLDAYAQWFYLPKKLVAKDEQFFQTQELTCKLQALPNANVGNLIFQSLLVQGMIRDEFTDLECVSKPNEYQNVFETTNPGYPVFQMGGDVINVGMSLSMQF